MEDMKLGTVESRFAEIIWENEPIASGELVKKCQEELSWKKSTTYTVLKKLCEKGLFRNEKGVVTSLVKKDELDAMQSEKFVEEKFGGSLPAFFAAFTKRKNLTQDEVDELIRMVNEYKEK